MTSMKKKILSDTEIDGTLTTTDKITGENNLEIDGTSQFNDDITVGTEQNNADTTIHGDLTVNNGDISVSAGNISQTAAPSGQTRTTTLQDTTLKSLSVTEGTTVEGTLGVTGKITGSGQLQIDGTSQFNDNVTISSGKKVITPAIDVSTITGTNSNKLSVTTPVEVTGSVTATDNVSAGQDVSAGRDLAVTRNATIGGTLGVTGATSMSSMSASGNIVQTSGTTTLKGTTVDSLASAGNATIGGTLGVTGQSTLGVVDAGATTLDSVHVEGASALNGAVTMGSTLGVTGATTLSTVSTSGKATLDNLEVTNASVLKGTLDVTGTAALTSATTTGNVSVGGTLGAIGKITGAANAEITGETKTDTLKVTGLTNGKVLVSSNSGQFVESSSINVQELNTLENIHTNTTIQDQLDGKAPTNHASEGTTYGVGTPSLYGHVMFDRQVTPNRLSNSDKIAISEDGIIDFVNQSVNNIAAYYITYHIEDPDTHEVLYDGPFPNHATLLSASASELYSGGHQRTPTRNDYTIVSSDESHEQYNLYDGYANFDTTGDYIGHYVVDPNDSTVYILVNATNHDSLNIAPGTTEAYERIVPSTRYIYNSDSSTYSSSNWNFQYTFNQQYTQAQMAALNSGITAAKVDKLDTVERGAEVNVNADWNASSGDAEILNKPTTIAGYGITDAVQSNTAITAATKCKITYDSKGLVTAGADLIESDIPALSISKTTGLQTALDNKLDDNQLVTAWQNTVSDSSIPSEKLVKHDLDLKVDKTTTINGYTLSNNISLSKSDIGLGNCDNTSDLNKPISTATQTALDGKLDDSQIVTSWQNPTLDSNIPSERLTKDTLDTKLDKVTGVSSFDSVYLIKKNGTQSTMFATITNWGPSIAVRDDDGRLVVTPPVNDNQVTTKKYVDDTDATKVTGPSLSADGNVVFFDGTTGKLVKDSGFTIPAPTVANVNKALVVGANGEFTYGGTSLVDDVRIGLGQPTDTVVSNKIAVIPIGMTDVTIMEVD